jgi:hypothetical protein
MIFIIISGHENVGLPRSEDILQRETVSQGDRCFGERKTILNVDSPGIIDVLGPIAHPVTRIDTHFARHLILP